MLTLPQLVRCKIGCNVYENVRAAELSKLPGYTLSALVAFEGSEGWQPAFTFLTMKGPNAPAKQYAKLDPSIQNILNNLSHVSARKENTAPPARTSYGRIFSQIVRTVIRSIGLMALLGALFAVAYWRGPALLQLISAARQLRTMVMTMPEVRIGNHARRAAAAAAIKPAPKAVSLKIAPAPARPVSALPPKPTAPAKTPSATSKNRTKKTVANAAKHPAKRVAT